ncbi:MAG TPA: biotin/lipoate A/B protein ligase family protein [Chloroflexota bacterium]|nr:biotin/lipoate A/B protein ligase family protein [Chloroflexota bacterium]
MAIDEALLTLVGQGASPPTVRFYTWDRPWVSLGSGQQAGEIDRAACAARGWGIVRRASGGTAVLHAEQVAYSITLPAANPLWVGDLAASYRRFAEPLRAAFARLGVAADLAAPDANAEFQRNAPALARRICFAALGPYEHLVSGKKLVGNSQVRRRHANAQHGVIQVSGNQTDLIDVLSDTTAADRAALRAFLGSHIGSLAPDAPAVSLSAICDAITAAFGEGFDVEWERRGLSEDEIALTDALGNEKYGADEWTLRR